MDTIILLLMSALLWILSQWKFIIGIGVILWTLKNFQDKINFYEEKLLDIDDNVKQIADKLGVFEDTYDTKQDRSFSEIYKDLKGNN